MRALISIARVGYRKVTERIDGEYVRALIRELKSAEVPYEIKIGMPGWFIENHEWLEFEHEVEEKSYNGEAFKFPQNSIHDAFYSILRMNLTHIVQVSFYDESGNLMPC